VDIPPEMWDQMISASILRFSFDSQLSQLLIWSMLEW
jgi:hypothetical protein